jgi:hypothetical protein
MLDASPEVLEIEQFKILHIKYILQDNYILNKFMASLSLAIKNYKLIWGKYTCTDVGETNSCNGML